MPMLIGANWCSSDTTRALGRLFSGFVLFRTPALEEFDIRNVYGAFALDNGAAGIVLSFALMFFDEADTLDNNLRLSGITFRILPEEPR